MSSKPKRARPASAARAAARRPAARGAGALLPAGGSSPGKTHRRSPEIINAAARVFADRGYHGASTQDIADVLGIRQASLYYYFPSKEVALEIVCSRGVEDFYNTARAIAAGPGTVQEKLTSLIRAHISPLLDRGDFVKVFLTQRQFLPSKSRRRVGRWSTAIERLFETVIRQGMRDGAFRAELDPRLATLGILGMANAVASWYGKEKASIERIGNEFAALTLRGLAAAPKPSGRQRRLASEFD
jgi:AcrR family transcriptional regulator